MARDTAGLSGREAITVHVGSANASVLAANGPITRAGEAGFPATETSFVASAQPTAYVAANEAFFEAKDLREAVEEAHRTRAQSAVAPEQAQPEESQPPAEAAPSEPSPALAMQQMNAVTAAVSRAEQELAYGFVQLSRGDTARASHHFGEAAKALSEAIDALGALVESIASGETAAPPGAQSFIEQMSSIIEQLAKAIPAGIG